MALTEIASIELLGEKFKLGKNGKVCLVKDKEDAWGNSYGKDIELSDWLSSVGLIVGSQALLDALGEAHQRLRQSRDSKLGVGKSEKES